ncbi:MAG: hypothetical protein V2J10_05105 [Wenzhouxiangella sp.]|jgi:hypothetical protein|nr:hypothetical protein [Wenzhouxiangella sp.]
MTHLLKLTGTAIIFTLLIATGSALGDSARDGADTPEDAYAALQASARDRDTQRFAELVVPGLRGQFMLLLWHFSGELAFGSDDTASVAQAYEAIAERHGFLADLNRYEGLYRVSEDEARTIIEDMRERLTNSPRITTFIAETLAHIADTMRAQEYTSTFLGHIDVSAEPTLERVDDDKAKVIQNGRELWFYRPDADGPWYFWASELPFL